MKVIFNILLIAAAGGAAFFSFAQSKKFEVQKTATTELAADNAKVTADVSATEKEKKDDLEILKAARDEKELAESSVNVLKASETSLKRDIAGLDTTLAGQKTEFDDLNKVLEDVNKILAELGGNVTMDNLGDEIVKMDESLKSKKARVEELATLIDGAEKKITSSKGEATRLSDRAIESSIRISRNAMEAVVTAVNQDWGFLVIGAGSNSGFTPQTSLLVKRDGRLIGRVRPTSIEATQTIADIDLNSLAAGVRIQPGDRVMLATPAAN